MVRVLAFNSNGNGIPGEAKEIKMEEGGVLTDSFMDDDQNQLVRQGQYLCYKCLAMDQQARKLI